MVLGTAPGEEVLEPTGPGLTLAQCLVVEGQRLVPSLMTPDHDPSHVPSFCGTDWSPLSVRPGPAPALICSHASQH